MIFAVRLDVIDDAEVIKVAFKLDVLILNAVRLDVIDDAEVMNVVFKLDVPIDEVVK
jgi:hypothetical protein